MSACTLFAHINRDAIIASLQTTYSVLSNRIQESGVRIQQCFLYDWRIASLAYGTLLRSIAAAASESAFALASRRERRILILTPVSGSGAFSPF
ncbi:hypothetical protein [Nostoc commune]|uniref:hypothetical protein n=1 Tax=Nostoc commune TaxID=1178 RepID=UPI002072DB68|nr:hypothetical protein [Nostoc commune]